MLRAISRRSDLESQHRAWLALRASALAVDGYAMNNAVYGISPEDSVAHVEEPLTRLAPVLLRPVNA